MTTAAEPIHPGEHLAEMLDELGVSQYRLAKTVGVPAVRINDIVHCRRSITADTALRLGRALRMTPEFWLNLQRMYDLDLARGEVDLSGIEPLFDAPEGVARPSPSKGRRSLNRPRDSGAPSRGSRIALDFGAPSKGGPRTFGPLTPALSREGRGGRIADALTGFRLRRNDGRGSRNDGGGGAKGGVGA